MAIEVEGIEVGVWQCLSRRRAKLSGRGLEVGGYRSRGLERIVLEGELSGDIAAGATEVEGYGSTGLERTVLEETLSGDIAARSFRSRSL